MDASRCIFFVFYLFCFFLKGGHFHCSLPFCHFLCIIFFLNLYIYIFFTYSKCFPNQGHVTAGLDRRCHDDDRNPKVFLFCFVKHSSRDTGKRRSTGNRRLLGSAQRKQSCHYFIFFLCVRAFHFKLCTPRLLLFVALFTCLFSPSLEKPLPSYPNLFVYRHFIDFFFFFFYELL